MSERRGEELRDGVVGVCWAGLDWSDRAEEGCNFTIRGAGTWEPGKLEPIRACLVTQITNCLSLPGLRVKSVATAPDLWD